MPIDLNRWHHAVNQVSGSMALRFNTIADLAHWARALRTIAGEMAAVTVGIEAAASEGEYLASTRAMRRPPSASAAAQCSPGEPPPMTMTS
jgi:hypothetical protein